MVVAGVGVEHFKLVNAVQKYFVDIKPLWESEVDLANINKNLSCDHSIAQYTGGMVQVRVFSQFVEYYEYTETFLCLDQIYKADVSVCTLTGVVLLLLLYLVALLCE